MSEKTFFFVKREIPLLFFVNCERADLFFVKRDLYRPFTTLYVASEAGLLPQLVHKLSSFLKSNPLEHYSFRLMRYFALHLFLYKLIRLLHTGCFA